MTHVSSKPLSGHNSFMATWAAETLKNNIATANGTLSQLLTLSTALMGSGVYFLNENVLPTHFLKPTLLVLFAALLACMFANLPIERTVDVSRPSAIEAHKIATLKRKRLWIWLCSGLIATALSLAVIGVLSKAKNASSIQVSTQDARSRMAEIKADPMPEPHMLPKGQHTLPPYHPDAAPPDRPDSSCALASTGKTSTSFLARRSTHSTSMPTTPDRTPLFNYRPARMPCE